MHLLSFFSFKSVKYTRAKGHFLGLLLKCFVQSSLAQYGYPQSFLRLGQIWTKSFLWAGLNFSENLSPICIKNLFNPGKSVLELSKVALFLRTFLRPLGPFRTFLRAGYHECAQTRAENIVCARKSRKIFRYRAILSRLVSRY